MIALIRPVLFTFLNSPQVKKLIVDLLTKLAESTDNTIDDQAVLFIKNGLFPKEWLLDRTKPPHGTAVIFDGGF